MKKYLVIGNPIKHSLSPTLHNSGYPNVQFDKKVDFENLYNQRFN